MNTSNNSMAYLPATTVLAEFNHMISEVSVIGVRPDRTTIGGSFTNWSAALERGQTGWIYSLERFNSITELVTYNEAMTSRGITVRSIRESWFNDPSVSGCALLEHLFRLGESIHGRWQPLGPAPVRRLSRGPVVKVPASLLKAKRAVELRTSRKLSVAAACRMAGCGVSAYYRYLKQQEGGDEGGSL